MQPERDRGRCPASRTPPSTPSSSPGMALPGCSSLSLSSTATTSSREQQQPEEEERSKSVSNQVQEEEERSSNRCDQDARNRNIFPRRVQNDMKSKFTYLETVRTQECALDPLHLPRRQHWEGEGGSIGNNNPLYELCCAQSCRDLFCTLHCKTTSTVGSNWVGQSRLVNSKTSGDSVTSLMTSPSSSSANPEGLPSPSSTKSGIRSSSAQPSQIYSVVFYLLDRKHKLTT